MEAIMANTNTTTKKNTTKKATTTNAAAEKRIFDASKMTKEDLKGLADECLRELEDRKTNEEFEQDQKNYKKRTDARSVIYDKQSEIAEKRNACREKADKIMKLIYKTEYERNHAGILNIKKRFMLEHKLERLYATQESTWAEFERLNDLYNTLSKAAYNL